MPSSRWSSSSSSDNYNSYDNYSSSNNHSNYYNNPPPFNPHNRYRSGSSGGGFSNEADDNPNNNQNLPFRNQPVPLSGQKRGSGGFPLSGSRGVSPDKIDGGKFAKLFIGSVPRTATEEDIRPLFEEHGNVIEVALIKDKRTGQQQGCCFIKYATPEEADRAIRALHNQCTLPGGTGPIQVRYADGERERLGAVEYKLFVGSLNRQATEKEVEEIFSPYGRVEDVYLMRDHLKQSRGCGFVKFSNREMAEAAIDALNGTFRMRGCDQPLIVRFADPKRPRAGESRFGPAFGGPGFGPRSQSPFEVRPTSNLGDLMGGRFPPNPWHPISPRDVGPSSQASTPASGSHLAARVGTEAMPSTTVGSFGVLGGPTNGSLQGLPATPSSTQQQSFTPSTASIQSFSQQMSPLQKPLQSPQHLPPSMQLYHQQPSASFSQTQTSWTSMQQLGQLQIPPISHHSFGQVLPSQNLFGLSGKLPVSQPQILQPAASAALQNPLNLQQQGIPAATNHQQLPASSIQQLILPIQQSPSQQVAVQQQTHPSSMQSPQQAFSQLQQQLHLMQPSSQSLIQQQNTQTGKPQSPWTGIMPQMSASNLATASASVAPSTISAAPVIPVGAQVAVPLTCNWTEHTSPEGFKYYYNSVTTESKWEKPEELTLFEQQQQQQKLQQQQHQQKYTVPQLQSQSQSQPLAQIQSTQQISQMQQLQPQIQLKQQQQMQLQQPSLSSSYQASGAVSHQNIKDLGYAQLQASNSSVTETARFQQGLQAAQEWMWKSKPAGA
ncbi:flowering time control protein FCA isoform X2 [Magnolia sinica]|uniref:flowering time control protein FCA isoform X2 n=1 Tax=Magnolia sinica TaxID=86752 RepID=UPI00265ABA4F|nr:flowering time control protein FCA isoform X2 [Magnolia sinica]